MNEDDECFGEARINNLSIVFCSPFGDPQFLLIE